jgi:hypothetical protein
MDYVAFLGLTCVRILAPRVLSGVVPSFQLPHRSGFDINLGTPRKEALGQRLPIARGHCWSSPGARPARPCVRHGKLQAGDDLRYASRNPRMRHSVGVARVRARCVRPPRCHGPRPPKSCPIPAAGFRRRALFAETLSALGVPTPREPPDLPAMLGRRAWAAAQSTPQGDANNQRWPCLRD